MAVWNNKYHPGQTDEHCIEKNQNETHFEGGSSSHNSLWDGSRYQIGWVFGTGHLKYVCSRQTFRDVNVQLIEQRWTAGLWPHPIFNYRQHRLNRADSRIVTLSQILLTILHIRFPCGHIQKISGYFLNFQHREEHLLDLWKTKHLTFCTSALGTM